MEQNAGNNQLITVDTAKSKMSIELTKANLLIQTIQNRASSLVFNEDQESLDEIKKFLADTGGAEKIIEETHKAVKKPYFDAGKAVDAAKNDLVGLISGIAGPVKIKFNTLCNEIDRKEREKKDKEAKRQSILTGVESNILAFSTSIAGCKIKKELTDVERLINLEKSPSRKEKYGELHEFAIERYDTVLLPIIKDQKKKVDEYEKLQEQLAKENNAIRADQIKAQLEQKDNEITQNQVKVQEQALNQQVIPGSDSVQEILPEITKAGSNMVCEIMDLKTVFKKHPELLNIDLKLLETKKLGSTLRDAGAFKGEEELVFDGIKFKIERKWK